MLELKLDFTTVLQNLGYLQNESAINEAVKKSLLKVAKQIQIDVKDKTPQDTLELLNSWTEEWDNLDLLAGYDIVYAMYQHQGRKWKDGTHIIKNRPAGGETFFYRKTLAQNLENYITLFEQTFFENIKI